jgi:hypothetical protein
MAVITPLYPSQTVTSTGPLAAVSISTFVRDWTLVMEVLSLSSGAATIDLEETLDGLNFRTLWSLTWNGPLGPASGAYSAGVVDPATCRASLRCYEVAGSGPTATTYMGDAGGELRANVVQLSAGAALTFGAWIET